MNENYIFIKDNNNNNKNTNDEIPSFLMDNLEYFRTPQVIINNEHLMLQCYKMKRKLSKIPYLSRNRNDLIIYDYKRKNNTKSSDNILINHYNNNKNNSNDYLQKILQNKTNISTKKINSYRNQNKKNQIPAYLTSIINFFP